MIATNNGSFPWRGTPLGDELEAALARHRMGGLAAEDLRVLQDRATRAVIEEQAHAGLDQITDGLVRRTDPVSHLMARLGGVSAGPVRSRLPGSGALFQVPRVDGEVAWTEPILVEDYLFAARDSRRPVKVVLTGPFTLAHVAEDRAYGDPSALATALAAALNQELRALQSAGASFLQIDEPALLDRKDQFPVFTRIWEVLGRGVSATLCLHLEGGDITGLYPGIARLKRLGCLSLDCVKGESSLDLLKKAPLPESLRLGLGVVGGGEEPVESPESLAARVRRLEGLPTHERIILGPASDLGSLTVAAASARLRCLATTARLLEQA